MLDLKSLSHGMSWNNASTEEAHTLKYSIGVKSHQSPVH